jgi:hypothetical protein
MHTSKYFRTHCISFIEEHNRISFIEEHNCISFIEEYNCISKKLI